MKRKPVDQRRIHRLEYELGIRDDPPPPFGIEDLKWGPGMVIPVDCNPVDLVTPLPDGRFLFYESPF